MYRKALRLPGLSSRLARPKPQRHLRKAFAAPGPTARRAWVVAVMLATTFIAEQSSTGRLLAAPKVSPADYRQAIADWVDTGSLPVASTLPLPIMPEQLDQLRRAQREVAAGDPAASLGISFFIVDQLARLPRRHTSIGVYRLLLSLELSSVDQTEMTQEQRLAAASICVEMGRSALRGKSWGAAQRAFTQALSFDPQTARAHLGRGYVHELYGRRSDAIAEYQLGRDDDEARLRLAVNLLRDDRTDEAEPLLRRLGEASPQPWIRRIAWQELAAHFLRRAMAQGASPQQAAAFLQRAEAVADLGIATVGDDQPLTTVRAAIADRRGHTVVANRLLDNESATEESPTDESPLVPQDPDPRARYSRAPALELAAEEVALLDQRRSENTSALRRAMREHGQ